MEDLGTRGQRAFSCSVDCNENWDMEEKQYVRLLRGGSGGKLGNQEIYFFGQSSRTWRRVGCVAWERDMLKRVLRLGTN